MTVPVIHVIGGGLAGCECAYQLLKGGYSVKLHEMRPNKTTPAHQTANLAELVCSNSFKSLDENSATGLLKAELGALDSLILKAALKTRVPAGHALAVDRDLFSAHISSVLHSFPQFEKISEEVLTLPSDDSIQSKNEYWVIATGPLTSDALSKNLMERLGTNQSLYFYDAIAPIIATDSIDMNFVYKASRYQKGGDEDYLNIPLSKDEYYEFVEAISQAEYMPLHDFEKPHYFEGCLPVEEMISRGKETLRFGPMKPMGLIDPRTNLRPYGVIQLRQENQNASMYSMVGFQTKMKWPEQKRVFSMLPAFAKAEFLRYGSIHRNTFVNGPMVFNKNLSLKNHPRFFLAGQITGVEGYLESCAIGLLVGLILHRELAKLETALPPPTTMLGALLDYVTLSPAKNFQPMNTNFGLLGAHSDTTSIKKFDRKAFLINQARQHFNTFLHSI